MIPKKSGVIYLSQILLQFLTKFFFDDGIVRVINKIISKMTYSVVVMRPQLTHRQPQSDSYDYGLHHNHEDFDTD